MALSRQQSVHTYSSASGSQEYLFDVVVDAQGALAVRNIRSHLGLIMDTFTQVPQVVVDDMAIATDQVTLLQLETEADSGNIVFAGDTSVVVVIPGGVLNNTNYRVVFTTPDGTLLEAQSRTTTGFNVVAAAVYGTIAVPVTVGYSVLVKTAQTSDLSGVVVIADTDAGSKAVVFAAPLPTVDYRVVLEPQGFFDAYVPAITKLVTGFTIELGHTPPVATSVNVGYDVFV